MAKLPFSGFTAQTTATGTGLVSGPRVRATPEDFGAGLQRAIGSAVGSLAEFQEERLRAKEQHERRSVQVTSARIATEFEEDLNEAAKTGADLEEVREKYEERLGAMQDNLETTEGAFQAQLAYERGRDVFGGMVRSAEAKRVGMQARNQTSELQDLLGQQVLKNPDALPIAQDEMVKLIDTFDLSPEAKRNMVDVTDRELAKTAATSMLEQDPARLKGLLLNGGIKGLTPGDQAQFLSRANNEIEAAERKSKTKDNEAKFQLMKAMSTRATLGLVSDEERDQWFEEGATASQFVAMQTKAQKIHDERMLLAHNAQLVGIGRGSSLSENDYQDAVNFYVRDGIEGDDPAAAGERAVEIRVDLAIRNGKKDREIATAMNAGATGGENAFTLGAIYYNELLTQKPTLAAKMVEDGTEYVYDAYNFYRSELGMTDDQAMKTAQSALLERGQISADLQNKENRELIDDAIDELTTIDEVFTDNRFVRKELIERTHKYMAYQPRLSVEQALKLAQQQFERHHVRLEPGYWVENKGVPEDYEEADNWVRRIEMQKAFEAMGLPKMDDALLRNLQFIPIGNGEARVLHPDTGQVIIPNFPWQKARDRWHTQVGLPEEKRKSALLQRQAEERLEREQQDRAQFLQQQEELSGADLTPQALGL